MTEILPVFAISLLLAYLSEQHTERCAAAGTHYDKRADWAYILLIIVLTLFAGLRTNYNDTFAYMRGFRNAPNLADLISKPDSLKLLGNPLFHLMESAIKTLTDEPQWLIFVSSVITQTCFIRFFKRYSENFLFSIFLYFTLGTFVFTLAALKQVLAMAVLTLAFPHLEKQQWGRFYLLVFIAMLFHTYAMAFAVLPLFRTKPWSLFTFVFIAVLAAVMLNFETAITAFMDQANDLGKDVAEYEVFDDATINVFRLAVYAVPPLISLVFRKWVLHKNGTADNILIHMSIISLAFMILGTQSGANMFGRMGNYFELGAICCLPIMLKKTFENRSYRLIAGIACICFMGFFIYANAIKLMFDHNYSAISIFQLLFSNV